MEWIFKFSYQKSKKTLCNSRYTDEYTFHNTMRNKMFKKPALHWGVVRMFLKKTGKDALKHPLFCCGIND